MRVLRDLCITPSRLVESIRKTEGYGIIVCIILHPNNEGLLSNLFITPSRPVESIRKTEGYGIIVWTILQLLHPNNEDLFILFCICFTLSCSVQIVICTPTTKLRCCYKATSNMRCNVLNCSRNDTFSNEYHWKCVISTAIQHIASHVTCFFVAAPQLKKNGVEMTHFQWYSFVWQSNCDNEVWRDH